jgi:hypothetical protein
MRKSIWLIALLGAATHSPAAHAQIRGINRVATPAPPVPAGEQAAQPPAIISPEPSPEPPTPATRRSSTVARPQSLEQQVADLQNAVSALQTQVERLEALRPAERDHYLAAHSPGEGITCSTGSLLSLNDTIQRTRADADDRPIGGGTNVRYYRPPALVWVYYGCRNASGRQIGDAQVLGDTHE